MIGLLRRALRHLTCALRGHTAPTFWTCEERLCARCLAALPWPPPPWPSASAPTGPTAGLPASHRIARPIVRVAY